MNVVDILPSSSYGEAYWEVEDLVMGLRKALYAMERGDISAELVRIKIPAIKDRLDELAQFLEREP